MIIIWPERCIDCDCPLYFDVEAGILYCPRACGNEILIGEDDEE